MTNSLVSIIIPTYNRVDLIQETLESILFQSYTNWECIIVDDGSTDNTYEIVNKYVIKDGRFQYHKRPDSRAKGANACRNYGFEISKGAFINWFDDDDLMHKDKLLLQLKKLENSNYDFNICQTAVFNKVPNSKEVQLLHPKIASNNPFEDFMKREIVWLTQAPLIKRTFLESFDYLFDEDLLAAQEWEFFCRVLLKSTQYDTIDDVLVYNRWHENRLGLRKDFSNQRLYHYYLARVKIEKLLKKDKGVSYEDYFLKYYLSIFRLLILNKEKNKSQEIFEESIKKRISFKKRIEIKLISTFYLIFGKGYNLLKRINYIHE